MAHPYFVRVLIKEEAGGHGLPMKEELLQEAPKPNMDSEGVRLLPDGSDGQPLDPADALETCVSSSREGGAGVLGQH